MRYVTVCVLLAVFTGFAEDAKPKPPDRAKQDNGSQDGVTAGDIDRKEAQAIAERYVRQKGVDLSAHNLASVRFLRTSPWAKKPQWIVTWELKVPADGGQVFAIVTPDKQVRIVRGL